MAEPIRLEARDDVYAAVEALALRHFAPSAGSTATEHQAQITWSGEQVRKGLPDIKETIDPSWLGSTVPPTAEGWSLSCRFDSPPSKQGNPSVGYVRFLVPEAPHAQLKPGAVLRLFERATLTYATVAILEQHRARRHLTRA